MGWEQSDSQVSWWH